MQITITIDTEEPGPKPSVRTSTHQASIVEGAPLLQTTQRVNQSRGMLVLKKIIPRIAVFLYWAITGYLRYRRQH